jgi:hypothetical protein
MTAADIVQNDFGSISEFRRIYNKRLLLRASKAVPWSPEELDKEEDSGDTFALAKSTTRHNPSLRKAFLRLGLHLYGQASFPYKQRRKPAPPLYEIRRVIVRPSMAAD